LPKICPLKKEIEERKVGLKGEGEDKGKQKDGY
jgi:hypothetical protein